jgi:hypothetical protein
MTKEADITKDDAEFICKELKRRGMIKSYVLEESEQAIDFIIYLTNFWDWEKSPYIKEKLRRNHGIHKSYVIEMAGTIKKYWIPFFMCKSLGEITRQNIEAFIYYLESLPEQAEKEQEEIDKALQEEKLKTPKRKNAAQKKRKIIRYPKSAKKKCHYSGRSNPFEMGFSKRNDR